MNLRNLQILHRLSVGPVEDPCRLPPAAGNCKGICPRWYYDSRQRSCRPFNYGCCGGNANNFKTRRLCENTCREDRGRLCKYGVQMNLKVFKNHRSSLYFDKMFGYFHISSWTSSIWSTLYQVIYASCSDFEFYPKIMFYIIFGSFSWTSTESISLL